MGYNRSGQRRKQRLRRNKRETMRLEAKAAVQAAEDAKGMPTKVVEKVKGLAKEATILAKQAVGKVEDAVQKVVKKVKGQAE